MKFSVNKSELQSAISVVLKGVSGRSTIPVLSGIFAKVSDDKLTLQSTDLELSIQYSVPVLVEEEGSTVFPGKFFFEIVKNLPDAAVHITTNDSSATAQISCDASTFSIRTLSADDFPGFPSVATEQTLIIPFNTFSQMVRRVSKAVSHDESRAVLTGIFVETEGDSLRMVATDSYRLAISEVKTEGEGISVDDDFSAVISGAFMNDIAGLNAAGENVSIGLSANQIVLACANMVFINRRIEGQYPNYRQLISDERTTRATFPTDALAAAVKRASLMSSVSAPLKFTLTPSPTNLASVAVNSTDLGSVMENIECQIEGEEVEIAFNSTYVLDGLSVMGADEVYFDVQSPLKPGIFRSIEPGEYLYLVMPVRLN